MTRCFINAFSVISAQGSGVEAFRDNLFSSTPRELSKVLLKSNGTRVMTGKIQESLPSLPEAYKKWQCRNHAIAYAAFEGIREDVALLKERHPLSRIGIVIGSSTSGMDATEKAFASYKRSSVMPPDFSYESQHELGSVAEIISELSGVHGPAYAVSTACSSSAKAFASAVGLIQTGICDAVITGGVDTLCDLTLEGFHALGLLSPELSNPMSRNRKGMNIGEGGALFIVTKTEAEIFIAGLGESADAHHISSPRPDGQGALSAMQRALDEAEITPDQIGYLNLHGTGTPANDAAEANAVHQLFGESTPCSSTKPLTGHCLGAAGAIEIAACVQILQADSDDCRLPVHRWDGQNDSSIKPIHLVSEATCYVKRVTYCLSNSFAFGGNNCAAIFGRQ